MELRAIIILLLASIAAFPARGQEEVSREVNRLLEINRNTYPAMRPQVFFSQDKYTPGDTAFFRLFILTETERILAERALFTIELVNKAGKAVVRQAVTCLPFGAANQLILPDQLEPGNYEVRIFSDRMTVAYGLTTSLLVVGNQKLVPARSAETTISFHPEGGSLVPGTLNRLVIRAAGRVPESASLHGEDGRISLVEFNQGLASIHFIPVAGKAYFLEYVTQGQVRKATLPNIARDATSLRVYPGPKKTHVIDIFSGPKAPRDGMLLLIAGRQLLHSQPIRLNSEGKFNLLAAAGFFPEGFSELFFLNEALQPLAYRPVYVSPAPRANVSINDVPEVAGLRTDVNFSVTVTDEAGQPLRSSLTIAVIPDETRLRPMRTPDPSLELRNAPPQFDWSAPSSRIELEIISRYTAPRLVPDFPVLLHSGSLSLSGRVYAADQNETLPYMSRMVIYLHNDLIQYETPIDGSGNFHFDKIYDFMGADKVFYKVINQKNQTLRAKADWSTNLGEEISFSPDPYEVSAGEDTYGVIRARKRTIDRSFNYFLQPDSSASSGLNPNVRIEQAFGGADLEIRPSEYVPFATMRELILEVIPALKFRVHGKDSVVEISPLANSNPAFVPSRYAEGNALYVIDGCITTNTNYLMSISPRDIEVVKIINDVVKLDKLQNLAKDGVLFIQTRIPEETRRFLDKELYPIAGLSPTLTMPMKYPTQKRIPDLRSLLYWTPLTDTDSTGLARITFRTSDLPGPYWIRVMGVTSTGHLFTTEKRLEVKFK